MEVDRVIILSITKLAETAEHIIQKEDLLTEMYRMFSRTKVAIKWHQKLLS